MGLPGEGGEAAPAAAERAGATPAVPAAAAPATPAAAAAPAPPPPPKPEPAYVRAAKERKKVPFFAMAVLSLLPLWAFMYVRSVRPVEATLEGPLALGVETYNSCSSCHGADGQGGAGRALWNGEVLKTFPTIEDMLNFVYTGSEPYRGRVYGNPDREGGAHIGVTQFGAVMPAQGAMSGGALTDAQILGVVCHERYTLGGADPASEEYAEEYATWCSPESEVFLALEDGSESFATLEGVGTDPRP
jgi:mono/diheme cytochrome c family protein